MSLAPYLSDVVPFYDERDNAEPLHGEIVAALASLPGGFECVYVDDGSRDGTGDVLAKLAAKDTRVRVVTLPANSGQTAALAAGFEAAAGVPNDGCAAGAGAGACRCSRRMSGAGGIGRGNGLSACRCTMCSTAWARASCCGVGLRRDAGSVIPSATWLISCARSAWPDGVEGLPFAGAMCTWFSTVTASAFWFAVTVRETEFRNTRTSRRGTSTRPSMRLLSTGDSGSPASGK